MPPLKNKGRIQILKTILGIGLPGMSYLDTFRGIENPPEEPIVPQQIQNDVTRINQVPFIEPELYDKEQVPLKEREDFTGNWISNKYAKGRINTRKEYLTSEIWADFASHLRGITTPGTNITQSKYKPTNSKEDVDYVAINNERWKQTLMDVYHYTKNTTPDKKGYYGTSKDTGHTFRGANSTLSGIRKRGEGKWSYNNPFFADRDKFKINSLETVLGEFGVYEGEDKKGKYVSYYDEWDVKGPMYELGVKIGALKPFEIYDRLYLDDYPEENIKNKQTDH